MKKGHGALLTSLILVTVFSSGCSVLDRARRSDQLEQEVTGLRNELDRLRHEKDSQVKEVSQELSELEKAKLELEAKLKKEIGDYKAKLAMTERGLVITFLTEIFFDSGKDQIRAQGEEALAKVASVLNANVADSLVAVEGHTDSDPIKYSTWKSNWELSSARALAVVHYLIDKGAVAPERLSAVGYGEYRPVSLNNMEKDKQQNRRVEIVILPPKMSKVKAGN